MPKVLIVDDEAPLTALVRSFFSGAGFEVETATSGQEALSLSVSYRPDVILLDIMMPDLDGYEVCRRLRADPRTARIVVVMLTARAQPVDKQVALRAGADAHVVKPFNGRALVEEVSKLLAKRMPVVALGRQVLIARLKQMVGATTLAANLAVGLAESKGCQAVAVDLTPGGGSLAAMLGMTVDQKIRGLSPHESAADWVGASLRRNAGGLWVLPGLPLPAGSTQIEPAVTAEILTALRGWFDYVVIDTPVTLGPLAPVLLGSSALVLLVLTADPAAARAAQLTTAAIQKHAGRPVPVWSVLTGPASGELPIRQQVEQVLGMAPLVMPWVSEDWAQADASHRPLVTSRPQSALSVAVRSLAARIAGRPGAGA